MNQKIILLKNYKYSSKLTFFENFYFLHKEMQLISMSIYDETFANKQLKLQESICFSHLLS